MRTSFAAVLLVVLACSPATKRTSDPGTGAASASGSGSGSASAASGSSGPSYGQPCGAAGACATGLTCVKYYGIAGASGPELSSCEKTCGADADCPAGMACKTIADGPGHVCR